MTPPTCPNCGRWHTGPLTADLFCYRCLEAIDEEAMLLVVALALTEGVRPTESCCGHGDTIFRIWLIATPEAAKRLEAVLADTPWPAGERWSIEPFRPEIHDDEYSLRSKDKGALAYGQARLLVRALLESSPAT